MKLHEKISTVTHSANIFDNRLQVLLRRSEDVVDLESLYSMMTASGLSHNPSSRINIRETYISADRSCCMSSMNLEAHTDMTERYEIPPVVWNGIQDTIFCLHPHNYELLE